MELGAVRPLGAGPPVVTVTPNPGLDLTYLLLDGGHLDPAVEVHRAGAVHLEASGKGVNVSRVLTLAGRPSTAVLPVGGVTGQQLAGLLARDGVPHRLVPQAGDTRVNTTVLTPAGPTTKINAPGAAMTAGEVADLVAAVDDVLVSEQADGAAGAGWLLICGSMPPGVDAADLVGRLVAGAHARGWRVAVDSSGAGLRAAVAAGADLLAPNAAELAEVRPGAAPPRAGDPVARPETGGLPTDVPAGVLAVAAAALALARDCGGDLLVSLGADGALWTDGRRAVHGRGPAVVPVNSAGAGDALLAGWFAAGPGERQGSAVDDPHPPGDPDRPDGRERPAGRQRPAGTDHPDRTDHPAGETRKEPGPESRLATAIAWGTAACRSRTTVPATVGDGDGELPVGPAARQATARVRVTELAPATPPAHSRRGSGSC